MIFGGSEFGILTFRDSKFWILAFGGSEFGISAFKHSNLRILGGFIMEVRMLTQKSTRSRMPAPVNLPDWNNFGSESGLSI